jgi:pyruvate/2-oxoglutarate dehydrogenase complex dihydrolipoamide acyltransferase (E2) component
MSATDVFEYSPADGRVVKIIVEKQDADQVGHVAFTIIDGGFSYTMFLGAEVVMPLASSMLAKTLADRMIVLPNVPDTVRELLDGQP